MYLTSLFFIVYISKKEKEVFNFFLFIKVPQVNLPYNISIFLFATVFNQVDQVLLNLNYAQVIVGHDH